MKKAAMVVALYLLTGCATPANRVAIRTPAERLHGYQALVIEDVKPFLSSSLPPEELLRAFSDRLAKELAAKETLLLIVRSTRKIGPVTSLGVPFGDYQYWKVPAMWNLVFSKENTVDQTVQERKVERVLKMTIGLVQYNSGSFFFRWLLMGFAGAGNAHLNLRVTLADLKDNTTLAEAEIAAQTDADMLSTGLAEQSWIKAEYELFQWFESQYAGEASLVNLRGTAHPPSGQAIHRARQASDIGLKARINGEALLLSEYQESLQQFKKTAPKDQQTPEQLRWAEKALIDQMVTDRLLAQEARRLNIAATNDELDTRLGQYRDQYGSELNKTLKKSGMTDEEFRRRLADQIAVEKLVYQEIKLKTKPVGNEEAMASRFGDYVNNLQSKAEIVIYDEQPLRVGQ